MNEVFTFSKTKTDAVAINNYVSLLKTVYPRKKSLTVAYLTWLYEKNPNGAVIGYDAYFEETLVAHYVTIPVLYYINGKETKGLLSLNTVTHPLYRGKKLFQALAKKVFDYATQSGFHFIIGVANNNSAPVFLNILGFKLIAPLTVRVGLGIPVLDFNKEYVLKAGRSNDIVEWRLSNPSNKYKQSNGFFIASSGIPGVAVLFSKKTIEVNLNLARKKFSLVNMMIGLEKLSSWKGVSFTLPDFLKPSPLLLIFKPLTDELPAIAKEDVLFEAFDFDAF
jgi:GNAT superfamily N-acetyltransferase